MKLLKSLLLTGLMLLGSHLTAKAEVVGEFESIEECISSCEFALQEADAYIKALQNERALQENLIADQGLLIKVKEHEAQQFYRNPLIMVPLGILIGISIRK